MLKDINLWGPRVRAAFEDMGVIGYADTDLDAVIADDEAIAEEFDRQHQASVNQAVALGADT